MLEFVVTALLPGTGPVLASTQRGSARVGRHHENEVHLDHPTVSRHHALLELRENRRFVIRDLASRNGTLVEGRILRGELREVATAERVDVRIGPYVLILSPAAGESEETLGFAAPSASRLQIHAGPWMVSLDGRPLAHFAHLEFEFLVTLAAAAPDVVERQALGDQLWGPDQWEPYMLHNLARRVRRRLADSGAGGELLVTEPRVGYRLA